ncbi:1-acyl-sn-glycerol-3-phosphate acyltransferase [Reichenbachiella carrageenanivorans]|uniref:1-acyl-sn-glycerol-3-phosphate acyltransferase n=1 Tax=Reichenbachiella carrageenanivorans TaxID=2979869 RepID=A0ABY6D3P7_9BACT|nr:1-acyl-sn-glycerol-3-phosphate acyltransferase [Reichenbachiella carrageenanivorans]UXX80776.1 1-acyl-sn-glycerol-3-phosphate acyltransferase [Reichenbachiella carrageenanivorans]
MIVIKYLWYYTFWTIVRFGLRIYFSKVKVTGLEKIPRNTPVIFGSNHENAFIDALLITTSNTLFDHYLVRAGVFKNAFAKAFLNSLNLMPVYRPEDGVNPLEANKQIFRACFETLAKKYSVMLFPEGEHNIRRHRRVLKKGISRIALGAVNFEGGTKELSIVPVGVNYADHTGFRSAVHIVFGEPIVVKQQEESAANVNKLTLEITEALSKVHVSLDRNEFEGLDAVLFHDQNPYQIIEPVRVNQTAKKLGQRIDEVRQIGLEKKELEQAGVIFPYRESTGWDQCKMWLLAPLGLFGLLAHVPVLLPVNWFVSNKVKDIEFVASLKFGFSLFGIAIWWWFLANRILTQTEQWPIVLLSLLVLVLGLIGMNSFVRKWRNFRMTRFLRANPILGTKYQAFVADVDKLRASLD